MAFVELLTARSCRSEAQLSQRTPDGGTTTGAGAGVAKTPEEGTEPGIEFGVCASANDVFVSRPMPSATHDGACVIKRLLLLEPISSRRSNSGMPYCQALRP